ncbi:hypothetical protein [Catelliglobosispora koreensis]|uniref:hypothetical protein n=1 Tax=Catelliglobosispora koreensis TaxID=129052 RepID=UPI0003686CEF|nr:hypothetical protein [Catelliglobosispora koreensis]
MHDEDSLAQRSLIYPERESTTIETMAELGRADVHRRSIIQAPFALAALSTSSRDWLIASLEATVTERGMRRVGLAEVANIRSMFGIFQEMDVMRGGGHARTTLVEFMNTHVMPLLRGQHDRQVQLALYEAASEQAYLIGWMAYDDGQHGLAQRYLIQALKLAEAAGSSALGAHILAGLSDQSNLLGHSKEAVALARAGQRGMKPGESPACLADLLILEARALSALGEREQASRKVAQAEQVFGQVVTENEPEWARFIDPAYFFGEAAHCFRDLGQPELIERFAGESLEAAQQQRRARRGALSQAALVTSQLTRGEVEAAANRAAQVVELAAMVNSSRCLEAVTDLKGRFSRYAEVPEVKLFNQRASALLGL